VGKDRRGNRNEIFRQRKGSEQGKNRNALAGFRLRSRLVTQVAERAVRVVIRAVVVPAAADDGGKHQQREQRQQNSKNAKGLS